MLKFLQVKAIPLLFGLCIIVCSMYNYDRDRIVLLAVVAAFIEIAVYAFYDFIAEKKPLLRYVSIIGSFIIICTVLGYAVGKGNVDDTLDFMIWFLSPQSVVEYSARYVAAFFVGISFFITSTVYYFTQIRYRIFVSFLLMMIPFAIFAKEYSPMPLPLMTALLISYFAVMVHCRQCVVNYKTTKVKVVNSKGHKRTKYVQSPENKNQKTLMNVLYKKSVGYFLGAITVFALIVPKPDIKANRDFFESILQASEFSRYMLSQLGGFSDTASSIAFMSTNEETVLFNINASEDLNLRAASYSSYSGASWHTEEIDNVGYRDWEESAEYLNPIILYGAVDEACEISSDFAQKYGLEDFTELPKPQSFKRNMMVTPQNFAANYVLSPLNTYKSDFTYGNAKSAQTETGVLIKDTTVNSPYTTYYYSQNAAVSSARGELLLKKMNSEIWEEFLLELREVLPESSDYKTDIVKYMLDYRNAQDFKSKYGNTEISDKVVKLAEKITDGLESDYEKACAIENYFYENGYAYSTEYIQPSNSNYEYFLLKGRVGACFDYATSMVMLAQAVGLPARFVQGFMMSDFNDSSMNGTYREYSITTKDAHAFPEVYISGYGWIGFEPTMSDVTYEGAVKYNYTLMVFMALITLLLIVFAIIGYYVILPYILEKLFKKKLAKADPGSAVKMTVQRIIKLLKLDESITAGEIAEILNRCYSVNFAEISASFDSVVYGGIACSEENKNDAMRSYIAFYENYIRVNKEERRQRRIDKKNAREAKKK